MIRPLQHLCGRHRTDAVSGFYTAPGFRQEDAFAEKASYLVMVDYLLNNELDDPVAFIRSVEHAAVKSFVHTVLSKIVITDGRVVEIDFKNGMTHKFLYK